MPLIPGKQHVPENIREFHEGKTYAHTKAKFGKQVAGKQAIAAALRAAGKQEPPKKGK